MPLYNVQVMRQPQIQCNAGFTLEIRKFGYLLRNMGVVSKVATPKLATLGSHFYNKQAKTT